MVDGLLKDIKISDTWCTDIAWLFHTEMCKIANNKCSTVSTCAILYIVSLTYLPENWLLFLQVLLSYKYTWTIHVEYVMLPLVLIGWRRQSTHRILFWIVILFHISKSIITYIRDPFSPHKSCQLIAVLFSLPVKVEAA